MDSTHSSSGKDSAASPQQQHQVANLNPSAMAFTPTGSAPSPAALPDLGVLAYHQAKAAEAANLVARVPPPPVHGPDCELTSEQGCKQIHAPCASETENTPPKSSSAPHSAGLSAGLDVPKTPPCRHIKYQKGSPTPPAYTFDDDDEYYPGTDPRLKRNARWVKC